MNKTILITGGAGYIGSHTAFLLSQKGYRIVIIDKLIHGQIFNNNWAILIKEDFANTSILNKIFKKYNIDTVMHFAAFTEIGESTSNPLKFYNNNVQKTFILLENMIKNSVDKFIFSSSCAIYGIPNFLPIEENHPKNPINPYGKTKLAIEYALEDLSLSNDIKYISLRYFNAAGALPEEGLGEQHNPETHIIPLLINSAIQGSEFKIFGTNCHTEDGTCIRDYLHVMDIAYAHWLAITHLNSTNKSDYFNIGTGSGFSVKDLIKTTEKICKTKIKVKAQPKRVGDPDILIANPLKAAKILGWKPNYSDLESLIRTAYIFKNSYLNLNNKKHTRFVQ